MRNFSDNTKKLFEWFIPFYERVLPKKPPKMPTCIAVAKASMLGYDHDPGDVPQRFINGFTVGFTPRERRKFAIHRITKCMTDHAPDVRRYMSEEYDVMVVHQDGDPTSKGIRIVTNDERLTNLEAVRAHADWLHAHCSGTHAAEDFEVQQINRLQPKAAIQRHKLVNLPLAAPKKK